MGTPYSATDPDLMLWVHAALVHVSLELYQRLVRRLRPEEEERYYREMAVVAQIFGTPSAVIPRSLEDFREYVAAQIDGGPITVTEPARAVAEVILAAPLPVPMRVLVPAHRLATAGTLPPRLREEYGLRWSPAHHVALRAAARAFRATSTPALLAASHLRRMPRVLTAER